MLISEAVPIYAVAIIIIGYIVGSIQNMEVLMMVEALFKYCICVAGIDS